MFTRQGTWLNYNSFKFINGQTVKVIPYIYLNSILDNETFPFEAYILVKPDGRDYVVYSYVKESELSYEK